METTDTARGDDESRRFFPVSIDSLDSRALSMELYLKPATAASPVLYRGVGVEFTPQDRARLLEQGTEFLYIPMHQHAAYRRSLTERLDRLFHDAESQRAERARVIRAACTKMIEDALLFPNQAEAIDAVAEISRQFVAWASEDGSQFSYLLDMSAHDYYTATHMVNVGVGCGLLLRAARPGDPGMEAVVVQGGLLHDLGKRSVPEEILNKEGKLEPAEWEQIRVHPMAGYGDLQQHPTVPSMVLEMARDHHERPDGKGYPNGLSGDDVGLAARICTIVDVFDAITAARPYRGPTPPDQTLDIMRKERGDAFDGPLLDTWCRIVEGLIEEDPSRAVAGTGAPASFSLADCVQQSPVLDKLDIDRVLTEQGGDERRRHTRFQCSVDVKARFIHQGKRGPVRTGESILIRMVDISRGGAQVHTTWPLSLNDVLILELPGKGGRTIRKHARVVRVRMAERGRWAAGLCFTGDAPSEPVPGAPGQTATYAPAQGD